MAIIVALINKYILKELRVNTLSSFNFRENKMFESLFYLLSSHISRFLGMMALVFSAMFVAMTCLQIYTVFQIASADLNAFNMALCISLSVILFNIGTFLLKIYSKYDTKFQSI